MMRIPLVSCIMPTYNRRRFVPAAIRCFLQQDYPNRELIIVVDGESVSDLVPPGATNIHLVRLHKFGQASIGAKLNFGIEAAHGEILARIDDDDWYHPCRLSLQVQALLTENARMSGSDQTTLVDLRTDEAWRYEYIPNRLSSHYVLGGTMMFTREFWRERPFEDSSWAEDNAFIFQRDEAFANVGIGAYVRSMHDGNTSMTSLEARLASDQWIQLDQPARLFVDSWWWEAVSQETI